jgi:chemotaxis protein methyltransferase CheR
VERVEPTGEWPLNAPALEGRADVERFRDVLLGCLGLRFGDDKLGFLAELLGRRLDAAGRDPGGYLVDLASNAGLAERRTLARELTVGETYFFRNVEQMRALVEVALPDCARRYPHRRPLRVLSAGCASGDEVYSLAILNREQLERAGLPIAIHGIELNPSMLERAARGRYSSWALRDTPADLQARYFRVDGRELVLDPEIRRGPTFEERNLVEEDAAFWRPGAHDVVFCRNVLMYFSPEVARAVVARLARSLVPGGYLFLGYAETMRGLSQEFHLRHTHGTFYYQRRDDSSREPVASERAWEAPTASRREEHVAATSGSPDVSWIETIRQASERIAALTATPSRHEDRREDRREGRHEDRSETAAPAAGDQRRGFDVSAAVELMRQERFGEASALLAALPSRSARDPDVLLLRAVLLTHGGDLLAAETQCREVLALDELSAGAHYLSALCREDAHDRGAAVEHDRIAAYLDPTFSMPRLHLGLLARRAGDHAAARAELAEALMLIEREDASRLLLYGGGFGRAGLLTLCRAELRACGETS